MHQAKKFFDYEIIIWKGVQCVSMTTALACQCLYEA